ncbi:hypothetical protein [Streptosporangium carneum]|uniref:Uncharacterized protein n=1 Tax=Streptosporangium carneum TaxID=47481 RepID=A0A9W6I6W7_9ACTN|nr:hypothetical protein [Streptosporangium carneum]GLK13232.1 hypothetical protein GCM10017600_66430 [Streptosporangium carneum]
MSARRRTSTSSLLAGWLFADLLLGVTIIMLGAQGPSPSPAQSPAAVAQDLPDTAQVLPEAVRLLPDATGSPAEEDPASAQPSPSDSSSPSAGASTASANASPSPAPAPSPATDTSADPTPSPSTDPSTDPSSDPSSDTAPSPRPTPSPCVSRLGAVQAKPITISFRLTPGAGDGPLASQVRQELLKHREHLAGKHAGMVLTFGADGGAGEGVRLATRVNTAIREAYPRIFGAAVTRNFHDLSAPPGSISMEIYLITYSCSPASEKPGS